MKRCFFMLAIAGLVILAGCDEEEAAGQNNKTEQGQSKGEATEEKSKEEQETDKVDAEQKNESKADASEYTLSSTDPLNVEMTGEVVAYDNQLSIAGKTNVPEGARIQIVPLAIGDSTFMGVSGFATVEGDGTFNYHTDIPKEYKGDLQVELSFKPKINNDEIEKLYGERGKKLKGPFIQRYETGDEIYKKAAAVKVHIQRNEDGSASKADISTPNFNKSDDYGNLKVRMEAEIKYNDDYVFVNGTSNLIEGSRMIVSIPRPEGARSGMRETVSVYPDGSFNTILENSAENKNLKDYKLRLKFGVSNTDWPTVKEKYGENGEKMKGKLIKIQPDDDKEAIKEITIEK